MTTFTPDALFGGNVMPVVTGAVTILKNVTAGEMKRGMVLGLIAKALGDVVDGKDNTGDGEIDADSLALGAFAQIGNYSVICTTADTGTTTPESDAKFAVYGPDGTRFADATQNVAYSNGHLTFTIGEATEAGFAVGDAFTIPVEAVEPSKRKAKLVCLTNTDGSAIPYGILAHDVDVSEADKLGSLYLTGEFNKSKLIVSEDETADMYADELRKIGIFLKKTVSA